VRHNDDDAKEREERGKGVIPIRIHIIPKGCTTASNNNNNNNNKELSATTARRGKGAIPIVIRKGSEPPVSTTRLRLRY
jgi:hypothetical protein